jgi:branched-chain amino acid transport system permease protein
MDGVLTFVVTAIIDGLALAMLLFLIACGLSIIFGLMGVLNFGHGAFFMLGAYIAASLFERYQNFAIAILGAGIFGMMLGLMLERLTLRPFHGKHLPQLLLTLGYLLVSTQAALLIWGMVPKLFYPPGLTGSVFLFGLRILLYRVFIILFGIATAIVIYIILTRTRLGIIIRAGAEDSEMVEALGINIKRVFTLTFGLGSALAAIGGAVGVPWLGANPALGLNYLFMGFVVTIVGGMGSFKGSFFGSLTVGMIHTLTAYLLPEVTFLIDFIVMAVVLLVRPSGLFGTWE